MSSAEIRGGPEASDMEKQVQLNKALAKENDALREQAQLDRGIIESLRCLEKAKRGKKESYENI